MLKESLLFTLYGLVIFTLYSRILHIHKSCQNPGGGKPIPNLDLSTGHWKIFPCVAGVRKTTSTGLELVPVAGYKLTEAPEEF